MQIINDIQLDFSDVLIQPKRSNINSRKDVNIMRRFTWDPANEYDDLCQFSCIPVSAANMGTVGTLKMARELSTNGFMCCLEKHYSSNDIINLFTELKNLADCSNLVDINEYIKRVFVSIGVRESMDVLHDILQAGFTNIGINIDVPNGYIPALTERVKECRKLFPRAFIIAGTVVTGDIVQDLIMSGASCVRVGIGGGSMCSTRLKTGVGRPQLSTIMECADAAHQLHGYVMSDGGITSTGDICKAFCAGADFVMCGAMFAGCDEAEGDIIEIDGNKYKKFYGMSSKYAQEKHFGGFSKYRASEGREKLIPSTGPLSDTLQDITGGIRSCCTYIGAHQLKHMPKHATFYRVNNQLNMKFANCKDF